MLRTTVNSAVMPHNNPVELPILALRDSVLFPGAVAPINVGRAMSVAALQQARQHHEVLLAVVAQRDNDVETPNFAALYTVGTLARVRKVVRLGAGAFSVVAEGLERIRLSAPVQERPFLLGRFVPLSPSPHALPELATHTLQPALNELQSAAKALAALLPKAAAHTGLHIDDLSNPTLFCDLVAASLPLPAAAKQQILATAGLQARLRLVTRMTQRLGRVHGLRRQLTARFESEMSRPQRETLLRQQLRHIRRELGESEDNDDDIEQLRSRIDAADVGEEVRRAAQQQLRRMRTLPAAGAEYQLARTYVEWLADLPWRRHATERLDVTVARQVLDANHAGVDKAKRRVIEHLAVHKLASGRRSPILCFVGPPGVGKTSLAKSIAEALGRPLASVPLGGVQDEAEIRGHRRTYVGAMPGRVIAAIKRAGVCNPVMVLDEIDKIGGHGRGDPAHALLEVLDPEQHAEFEDHYLGLPFDLRHVMFIATANRPDNIPQPLRDRMELLELAGYTSEEKRTIVQMHLLPKQLQEHGLTPSAIALNAEALQCLVTDYAGGAGVRGAMRSVSALCRWWALALAEQRTVPAELDVEKLTAILGPPRLRLQKPERELHPGVATGLRWTPEGGDLVFVEATRMPGSGQLHLTGRMGDVMRESAVAAFSYVRTRALNLGLPEDFLATIDVHVHLPQAAPHARDSAGTGATLLIALMSLLTRRRVRPNLAVTGEITLRGSVLRISGVRQKCLAAHRAGLKALVLPRSNAADLEEVPAAVRQALTIHLVHHVDEIAACVFERHNDAAAVAAQC